MSSEATTIVVAIFVSLFGLCVGLGAFIARSVVNRVGSLEGLQTKTDRAADSLEGRVLIVEGKVWVLEGGKRVRLGHEEDTHEE